jgi:hypothetical protein
MAFGWIGSTIAFGAVVRHRRGVGRYRRTFAHVAFRQISRLAGMARFSQRNKNKIRGVYSRAAFGLNARV